MRKPIGEWDETRTETVKQALKEYLAKSGIGWMLSHRDIMEIWLRCVGEEIAAETMPAGWRNGTLTVDVFSPTLRSELEGFFSGSILETVRQEAPQLNLRKIKFRLASRDAYEETRKRELAECDAEREIEASDGTET